MRLAGEFEGGEGGFAVLGFGGLAAGGFVERAEDAGAVGGGVLRGKIG
ncbi:MAG: hypothetical protein ACQCXQ_03235 [Verrucomicrobiales bacterium]